MITAGIDQHLLYLTNILIAYNHKQRPNKPWIVSEVLSPMNNPVYNEQVLIKRTILKFPCQKSRVHIVPLGSGPYRPNTSSKGGANEDKYFKIKRLFL